MLRRAHEPAAHRIEVNVVTLLHHHRLGPDRLRVRTFLPHLMFAFSFVRRAIKVELFEQPLAAFHLQLLHNFVRGELFEIGEDPLRSDALTIAWK